MSLDWSKGAQLHSLYGHDHFKKEAAKAQKPKSFVENVCQSLRCFGGKTVKGERA